MKGYLAFFLLLCSVAPCALRAQSTVYLVQGGLTIGTQRWDNGFERQPLFQWNGSLAIETLNNDDDKSALFMQLGYHVKGSASRITFLDQNGGFFQTTERFKFNNASLILGFKGKKPLGSGRSRYYYFGGLRGDYTINTNLDALLNNAAQYPGLRALYPSNAFVRHWIGGVSAGGGLELPLSDLVGAELRLAVHPDFTLQYRQPGIANVIDPNNPGQNLTINEQRIRNVAVELTLGIRLIRKVVYE